MRILRRFWPLLLLVLVAGTCQSNYAVARTVSEGMGSATGNEEILDGPVDREVVVRVPAGGLEGAMSGQMILRVNPHADPFPPVRFDIGPPFDESVIADQFKTQMVFRFDWEVPKECGAGCEFTVPVTIGYVEPEGTPTFGWTMEFGLFYRGAVPGQMEGGPDRTFTAEVQPEPSQ